MLNARNSLKDGKRALCQKSSQKKLQQLPPEILNMHGWYDMTQDMHNSKKGWREKLSIILDRLLEICDSVG